MSQATRHPPAALSDGVLPDALRHPHEQDVEIGNLLEMFRRPDTNT